MGIEPTSSAWEAEVMAIIRRPQNARFYRGLGGDGKRAVLGGGIETGMAARWSGGIAVGAGLGIAYDEAPPSSAMQAGRKRALRRDAMKDASIDLDKLVYLDLEFVSRKYEEIRNIDPSSKVTAQVRASGSVRAFFATVGASTQESRTYSITSREMIISIWPELGRTYEKFTTFENYRGTKIQWVAGDLTIGEWRGCGSEQPGYEYFELKVDGRRMAFLAQEAYFSAGFEQVFRASPVLKGNIGIPVRCLARIMWHAVDAGNFVCCPYLIVENC